MVQSSCQDTNARGDVRFRVSGFVILITWKDHLPGGAQISTKMAVPGWLSLETMGVEEPLSSQRIASNYEHLLLMDVYNLNRFYTNSNG